MLAHPGFMFYGMPGAALANNFITCEGKYVGVGA